MTTIRLMCWNVNGIRAIYRKGFLEWLAQESPDILCLQETKAHPEQLPKKLLNVAGYTSYFASAQRKGYSGTALYTRVAPKNISYGLGIEQFDAEGRTIVADFDSFVLYNIYYPNGQSSPERLQYKMEFYDAFLEHADALQRQGRGLVICGDVNTAHTEIDLARPKENADRSGFLPQERAWIDRLVSHGFVDTFRLFTREGGHYTWWDYKSRARERNVGWRIDYFFVSANLTSQVTSASIHADVMGSDHCPIELELEI